MTNIFRIILIIWLILESPIHLMACGPKVRTVKRPEGLRYQNPDPSHPDLTTQDRLKWKAVLKRLRIMVIPSKADC